MKKLESLALSLALCVFAVWAAAVPAVGAAMEIDAVDPVVAEVLEMLDAGVSDHLILRWLETTDRAPGDVSAAGLIALSEAEASEELIEALLRLAGGSADGRPATGAGEAPITEPEAPVDKAADDVAAQVEAHFLLVAKQLFTDEPEPDNPQPETWDVFVYLDGDLLGWVHPTLAAEPVEVRRLLSAGSHDLRVVLERYDAKSRMHRYDSLSVPVPVAIEARPGAILEVDLQVKRIWGLWRDTDSSGPLSYTVKQGTEILTENTGTGGDPSRWRPICEDIEANFPDAKKVPSVHRTAMSRCVGWPELWPDREPVTPRMEILAKKDG